MDSDLASFVTTDHRRCLGTFLMVLGGERTPVPLCGSAFSLSADEPTISRKKAPGVAGEGEDVPREMRLKLAGDEVMGVRLLGEVAESPLALGERC
jgi:hypothetical protein